MNQTRTVLAFLRHADYHQAPNTPSAHQPYGLTARGEEQAAQAAAPLMAFAQQHQLSINPNLVSSNLLRAWQTANILGDALIEHDELWQFQVLCDAQLNERSVGSVGSAANLTVAEIEQAIHQDPRLPSPPPGWKSQSDYCLPFDGAESLLQAGKRVKGCIENTLQKWPSETVQMIIVVGHGASFRHAAHLMGLMSYEQIQRLSMHYAQPLFFEQDADQQWHHLDGEWKIRPPKEKPQYID